MGSLASASRLRRRPSGCSNDPRTRSKIREFLLQWLKVDQPPEIAKDKTHFPDFTPEVAADLRTSLDLFLDDVVWSETSDFRELLQANWLYLNGRLAQLYRPDLPPDAPFMKMALDPGERAGVLTHPYLMAGFAYTATSSPIHRGRVHRPQRAGPVAAAAADGRLAAAGRFARRSDDPRADHAANEARSVPVVPRDDQSARLYAGEF